MVVFYVKFGEKISVFNFIGVSLMLASIICISVAATAGNDDIENFDEDDTMAMS